MQGGVEKRALHAAGAVLVVWCFISLSACSDKVDTSFKASVQSASDDVSAHTEGMMHTESFEARLSSTEEAARPIHMLWVVDNSGSMSEEIAAVRAGISSFVSGLASHTGVEVTMITQVSDSGRYAIPAAVLSGADVHVVNYVVPSQHKLHHIAEYLSAPLALKYGFLKVKALPAHLSDHPSADFIRAPEALKVFVVVTDDVEQKTGHGQLASMSLLTMLNDLYAGDLSSFRFYGFLSGGEGGHYKDYLLLLNELGGERFDIMNLPPSGWQDVLKKAQDKLIAEVVQRSFKLKKPAKKVLEVKIGGRSLSEKEFSVAHSKLLIKASSVKEGDKIEVVYVIGDS